MLQLASRSRAEPPGSGAATFTGREIHTKISPCPRTPYRSVTWARARMPMDGTGPLRKDTL